jgi:hypothetical protein
MIERTSVGKAKRVIDHRKKPKPPAVGPGLMPGHNLEGERPWKHSSVTPSARPSAATAAPWRVRADDLAARRFAA